MKTPYESIIDPNIEIRDLQQKTLAEMSTLLPSSQAELVGAMAVPMVGRLEIDVMILSKNIENDSKILSKNGYRQGPIEKEISYLKKIENDVEIGIQIMDAENKMVNTHRGIIQTLRDNDSLREKYEVFKKTLSGLSREEYKEKKSAWIRENLIPQQS